MQPLVIAFMVVWFSIVTVGLFGSIFLTNGVSGNVASVPLLMFCGGIALVAIGRFAARNEQGFLIEVLCNSLDARKLGARPGKSDAVACMDSRHIAAISSRHFGRYVPAYDTQN